MDTNNVASNVQSKQLSAAPAGQMIRAMKKPLVLWLGENTIGSWLSCTDGLPACSGLFLEMIADTSGNRCDIITRIIASDGTLSGIHNSPLVRTTALWRKTAAMMKKWKQNLDGQDGFLRTHCFAMWLEFDIHPQSQSPGDPSVFIALTPQGLVDELSEELGDYPELQQAIVQNHALLEQVRGSDALVLGHIGYMAARQADDKILPLRSCWRCNDMPHMYRLLELAGIPYDRAVLREELRCLDNISGYINSLMLDLDTDMGFMPGFSLELNVYKPFANSNRREEALLQEFTDLGFMSDEQKRSLMELSNSYVLDNGQTFVCSLHHIKLKFSGSRIREIKCYWQAALKPRSW